MDPSTSATWPEPSFRPSGRIVRAADGTALRDGRAWLAEARRSADRLLAEARAAADAERRRGFEEGRRAGERDAARLLAETAEKVDAYLESVQEQVAALAVEAVARILGSYDETDAAVRAIHHALQQARRRTEITVFVAPSLTAEVARRLAAALSEVDARQPVTVEPDRKLAPGRCVLASAGGFVEAGIAEQIEALRTALGAPADRQDAP